MFMDMNSIWYIDIITYVYIYIYVQIPFCRTEDLYCFGFKLYQGG